jgi:hypothetical protein
MTAYTRESPVSAPPVRAHWPVLPDLRFLDPAEPAQLICAAQVRHTVDLAYFELRLEGLARGVAKVDFGLMGVYKGLGVVKGILQVLVVPEHGQDGRDRVTCAYGGGYTLSPRRLGRRHRRRRGSRRGSRRRGFLGEVRFKSSKGGG